MARSRDVAMQALSRPQESAAVTVQVAADARAVAL